STAPYFAFAFPPGGQKGTSGEIELFSLSGSGALTGRSEIVAFPAGAPAGFDFTGSTPAANSIALETTDFPTFVEVEPNDAADAATPVAWPAVACGRFSSRADEDWYAFTAAKDQAITVECQPLPRSSGALPLISVCDANGGILAKASTVELLPKPCRLEWRAP